MTQLASRAAILTACDSTDSCMRHAHAALGGPMHAQALVMPPQQSWALFTASTSNSPQHAHTRSTSPPSHGMCPTRRVVPPTNGRRRAAAYHARLRGQRTRRGALGHHRRFCASATAKWNTPRRPASVLSTYSGKRSSTVEKRLRMLRYAFPSVSSCSLGRMRGRMPPAT